MPFIAPKINEEPPQLSNAETFKSITHINIETKATPLSEELIKIHSSDRLSIKSSQQHLMQITLDEGARGLSKDFRPLMPLVLSW